MNILQKIRKEIDETPQFIRTEYIRISSNVLVGGLITPIIIKTQGLEFSIMALGILGLVMRLKSLLVIFLKNTTMQMRLLLFVFSSIFILGVNIVYFVNIHIWIILLAIQSVGSAVILEMYYTEYDIIISRDYPNHIFKNMQYTEKLLMTIFSSTGAMLSIILSSYPNAIITLVIILIILVEIPFGVTQCNIYKNTNCE